ncbi:MAG: 5'/3'-nucleotidase SurE [Vicinamibacterales bacterium]
MRLLVSNDDGIHSPGLALLAAAAQAFGDVRVVAPDVEQSSSGHAITASRPLTCRPTTMRGLDACRVNGTPADCVALGLDQWDHRVDVVLSGLNIGLNLGPAVWHSGTLAAAKQAALLGVRGIALSAPASLDPDFSQLEPWLHRVLRTLLVDTPPLPLVNVNLPREPRGLLWTRASPQHYDGRIVRAEDPLGREIFWFTVAATATADDQSDRWAVEQRWVSLTPLTLDITDDAALTTLRRGHPLDEAVANRISAAVSSQADAARVRDDEAADPSGS